MDWIQKAIDLKFNQGKSWTETSNALSSYFPDLNQQQVFEKVRGKLRKEEAYKKKGKITYEDKREPTDEDVSNFYEQMKCINTSIMKLEQKQNKANIHLDDDKPIAIAFWGDWHIGSRGVDYYRFDKDVGGIRFMFSH